MPTTANGYVYVVVMDNEAPEQAQFSIDGSRSTMVLDFQLTPPQDMYGLIEDLLGFSYRNEGRVSMLSRNVPMRHPIYYWQVATQITSIQGRGPQVPQTNQTPLGLAGPFAVYQSYRCVVGFEVPDYAVMDDAEIGDASGIEQGRYVAMSSESSLEILQRRGCGARWAKVATTIPIVQDGQNPPRFSGLPPTIVPATPVDVGQYIRIPKRTIKLTWKQLPACGLFGTDGNGTAVNLDAGLGKVNSATFLAYPPGTVLFTDWKPIPHSSPCPPASNIAGAYPLPPRTYDVVMTFIHVDPPYNPAWYGGDPTNPANAYDVRGHNLAPLPPGTGAEGTGYWYCVSFDCVNNSNAPHWRLYRGFDMNTLFNLQ
jgi:hypothetical protein